MNNEIIDLEAYFSHSGTEKRRDEAYKDEFKKEYLENAQKLLSKVNAFLTELKVPELIKFKIKVNSGWRPVSVNKKQGGGSKSKHLTANGIDIDDNPAQELAALILANQHLLVKYGLYMENPEKTVSWVHLQDIPASKHVFEP